MKKIRILEIRDTIFDFMKAHIRLNNNGEVSYKGELVDAIKVYRWYKHPPIEFDQADGPSIHVVISREKRGARTQAKKAVATAIRIYAFNFHTELDIAMDRNVEFAKIIQQILEESSVFGGVTYKSPDNSSVDDIDFDAGRRSDDRFQAEAVLHLTVNYFEMIDKR